uniref:Ig-like domain-containing protein n=1 Tax=Biomphalaria glabrata TaxID=6526 RepID=A0A2C9JD97_BIOGL
MPNLHTLDLSRNNILSVSNGSFPAKCQLVHLNLNNNHISALEKGSMSNLTSLETLKMNKNKLVEIMTSAFHDMHKLKVLELMRNKLQVIKGLTFQGAKKLEILRLKKNNISQLKDGAFYDLHNLRELHLDNNSLVNVTKAWLFGLKKLETLSLPHNKISHIDSDAWEQCKNLVKLSMMDNRLTAITESTFAQLASLQLLQLDQNQISRIDDGAFKHLTSLTTLELNSNEISWSMEDVSGLFRGLNSLTKLSLKFNSIRSIAVYAFSGLPKLRNLYLEENDITSIQENAFETLRDLRDLRFNSTKLYCDCHVSWLYPWLVQQGYQNSAVGTCFHPTNLRGMSLVQVDSAQFKCNNSEFPKPVIIESPKSTNGFKGENLTLTCMTAITGGVQPTIQWKRNNMVLEDIHSVVTASSDGEVKHFTSHLILPDVQDSTAGKYHCVVSNEFGYAISQKAQINVYVYPVFLQKPKDVTVKAGKPAELKCAATGQPPPEISWQKDGGDNFPAARDRRMHVYPNDDKFFIMDTRIADEGVYSCMAKNEAGVIISNATVTVLETPGFVQPMIGKKTSKLGETSVLQCMASGSPQPKLTWLKDDRDLVLTPRHFFTVDNQILVIVDTQWSDGGVYACRMSNSLGTAKGTTELQVLSANGEPSESGSFGLDDESTTTGIIIIAVVCCVVGTSLVWVIIIYQTRKRHEVYSATPTDETTLPGEVPSSGYMSSDREGSYSQGPITTNYHYQDYQMKESGYESSSGQFRANGYNRSAMLPSDVDEDDPQPTVMTAGDRLLRQLKAAPSSTSLQYPGSDGDTIGSRHSTSSGHHSDPPSSHSGHSSHHPLVYQQLNVVTAEDYGRKSSSQSPLADESHLSQQLGKSMFQTFHPTKPTNHDRSVCGGRRGENAAQQHEPCDNLDVETGSYPSRATLPGACAVCQSSTNDLKSIHGCLNPAGNCPPCYLNVTEEGSKYDTCGGRCVQGDTKSSSDPLHPPALFSVPTPTPGDTRSRPKCFCYVHKNPKLACCHGNAETSGCKSNQEEVTVYDCCNAGATPSPCHLGNQATSPCCCEVVRDSHFCPHQQSHQCEENGVSLCSNGDCPPSYQAPHHRHATSLNKGRPKLGHVHCDTYSLHRDCSSCGCDSQELPLHRRNHPSCSNCKSCSKKENSSHLKGATMQIQHT